MSTHDVDKTIGSIDAGSSGGGDGYRLVRDGRRQRRGGDGGGSSWHVMATASADDSGGEGGTLRGLRAVGRAAATVAATDARSESWARRGGRQRLRAAPPKAAPLRGLGTVDGRAKGAECRMWQVACVRNGSPSRARGGGGLTQNLPKIR
jgi:hypothetical protein